MAKERKAPRQKAPIVRTGLKVLAVLGGAKMILDADEFALIKYHITHPNDFTASNTPKILIEHAKRTVPGVVVAIGGPKLIDAAYKALPLPEVKRAKVSANRKWL